MARKIFCDFIRASKLYIYIHVSHLKKYIVKLNKKLLYLIPHGRHEIVHLPAGCENFQQSIVQVIIPIEPQSDGCAAKNCDNG